MRRRRRRAAARWTSRSTATTARASRSSFEALGEPAELPAAIAAGAARRHARATSSCAACAGRCGRRARAARRRASGQRGHAWGDPDWDRIELARTVARVDRRRPRRALTAVRPAGAAHHGDEAVWARGLARPAGSLPIERAALSTTYDADGRSAARGSSCGSDEDEDAWPRRGRRRGRRAARRWTSARCGSTARSSAGTWRAATGVGRYDVLRRARRDPRRRLATSAACSRRR